MNHRRLVLAGGTVAWAAIGAVRRNRRPSRVIHKRRVIPATAVLPLYVALSPQFGYTVDWGGVWGGIWSFLGGITQGVKDFVLEAIQKAVDVVAGFINTVDDVYHAVTGVLTEGLHVIAVNAMNAASAVAGVVAQSYAMLDGAFSNLRQQLASMLEHAWDDVLDFARDMIPDIIKDLLGDVWDVLMALVGIGVDGVGFLVNLIDDPIGFLWDLLGDMVSDAIQAALDGLALGWDAFTGLFWPFLAHEFGLPDDPVDMVRAGKLLWSVALDIVNGRFEEAFRELLKGSEQYFEKEIPKQVHIHADTLVELLYSAMGIHPPDDLAESLKGV